VSFLFDYSLSLRHFVRITTVMARKKITADELNARAKANSYQRGIHDEEDSRRDYNWHVDKVKQDQDAVLDHYLQGSFVRMTTLGK
jgi:hypothetical protein